MPTFGEYILSTNLDDSYFPYGPLRLDTLLENENVNAQCVLEGKRLHERNVEAWLEKYGSVREKEIWDLLCKILPAKSEDGLKFDVASQYLSKIETLLYEDRASSDISGESSPIFPYLEARFFQNGLQDVIPEDRDFILDNLQQAGQQGFESAFAFLMNYTVESASTKNELQEVERLFLEHQDNEECQLTASQLLIRYNKIIPFSESAESILFNKLWERAQSGHIDALRLLFLQLGLSNSDTHKEQYAQKVLDLLEKQAKTQKDACVLLAMYKFNLVRFIVPSRENHDEMKELNYCVNMAGCFLDKLARMDADGPHAYNDVHPEWEQQRPLFEQAYALGDLWSGLFLAHQDFQTSETCERGMELLEKLACSDNYPPAQAYLATFRCTRMVNKDGQFNDNERTHTLMRTAAMQGGSLLLEKQYADYLLMKFTNEIDESLENGRLTDEAYTCLDELWKEANKMRPWACLALAKLLLCSPLEFPEFKSSRTTTAALFLTPALAQKLDEAVVFTLAALNCYPKLKQDDAFDRDYLVHIYTQCCVLEKPLCTLWRELREIGMENWITNPIKKEREEKFLPLIAVLSISPRRYGGAGNLLNTLRMLVSAVIPDMANPLMKLHAETLFNPSGHKPFQEQLKLKIYAAGMLYSTYYDLFIGVILAEVFFRFEKMLSPQQALIAGDILWPSVTYQRTSLRESRQFMVEWLEYFNVDIDFFKRARKLDAPAPKPHKQRTKKQRKRKK